MHHSLLQVAGGNNNPRARNLYKKFQYEDADDDTFGQPNNDLMVKIIFHLFSLRIISWSFLFINLGLLGY